AAGESCCPDVPGLFSKPGNPSSRCPVPMLKFAGGVLAEGADGEIVVEHQRLAPIAARVLHPGPDMSTRKVTEDVGAGQPDDRRTAIDETADDGLAAAAIVRILHDRQD